MMVRGRGNTGGPRGLGGMDNPPRADGQCEVGQPGAGRSTKRLAMGSTGHDVLLRSPPSAGPTHRGGENRSDLIVPWPCTELAALRGGLEISPCLVSTWDAFQGRQSVLTLAALNGGLQLHHLRAEGVSRVSLAGLR